MKVKTRDGYVLEFDPLTDGWIPHEYEETKQYDTFFPTQKDWTVVEVGAWMGLFTTWVSPLVKKVYALEPMRQSFEKLKGNIETNHLRNVTPLREAIFSKTGQSEICITYETAASTLVPSNWPDNFKNGSRTEVVDSYTWGDWVKKHKIEAVNWLKMDVEGSETAVLLSLLESFPERISIAGYHPSSPISTLFNILYYKGYHLDGVGFYDKRANNHGKPHSYHFRRFDIPFGRVEPYVIGEYELPTREIFNRGIPNYKETMGVRD